MAAKQIEVTCPCCSARLTVDVLTAQVLRRTEAGGAGGPEPKGDRWANAQDRVRDRARTGQDKLDAALEHERGKADRFDDLFRQAREKHSRKRDEGDEG